LWLPLKNLLSYPGLSLIRSYFSYLILKGQGGNHKEMALKLKDLEETRSFYKVELEKEELAGGERDSFLKALGIIEKCIEREEEAEKKRKDNKFIVYDQIRR